MAFASLSCGGFENDLWPVYLFVGLVQSQVGLAAIWIGIGPCRLPWRILITALIVWACSAHKANGLLGTLQAMSQTQLLEVALPLWVANWVGLRFRSSDSYDDSIPRLLSGQFRLRDLWAAITGIGSAIGLLYPLLKSDGWLTDRTFPLVLAAPFALVTIVSLWAVMGPRYLPFRFIAQTAITLSTAWASCLYVGSQSPYIFVAWHLVQFVQLTIFLGIFRYCGYRLEWRRPETSTISGEVRGIIKIGDEP